MNIGKALLSGGKYVIQDLLGFKNPQLDNNSHIKEGLNWLKYAQDKTKDGGVSGWYSLISGWHNSYIETTGYIISTFIDCSLHYQDKELLKRAIKMGDFLLRMQLPSGGFRSKVPSDDPKSEPVVFDTGQDILGLTDLYGVTKKKKYLTSATQAADFLCQIQENDGSFIKYEYGHMPHCYETRTAWALLKVYRLTKNLKYKKAASKTLNWALMQQQSNGYFLSNNLPGFETSQFTHIISYAIEGLLYSGLILKSERYINAAKKSAILLANYYLSKKYLSGEFDENWQSSAKYRCLTGDAQLSIVWLMLYSITGDKELLKASKMMNSFLKTTQNLSIDENVRGAIKGSLPIYGDLIKLKGYCRMTYLNWATKFFIDSLLMEEKIDNKIP